LARPCNLFHYWRPSCCFKLLPEDTAPTWRGLVDITHLYFWQINVVRSDNFHSKESHRIQDNSYYVFRASEPFGVFSKSIEKMIKLNADGERKERRIARQKKGKKI
jgi:hypothetical protein